MKVKRKGRNALFTTACMIGLLIVGCTAEDQAILAPSGGPTSVLIGFAGDFGRQLLAAFLF